MSDLSFDQTLDDVSLLALAALHTHTLDLAVVLPDITFEGMTAGTRQLVLNSTLDPVALATTSIKGRVIHMAGLGTAEAKLTAHVELGAPPEHPEFIRHARLYNLTGKVLQAGGAIICFVGPPWKTVDWRILEGHGTLTPFTTFTDELGRCSCRFDAGGFVERVVIGAAYVP